MYVPEHFAERDVGALHAFVRQHGFALLVTAQGGAFEASHVPLWLDAERGRHGTLVGHVARANPHARAFDGVTRGLAVFSGPHAYVSPTWYERPSVPTWNYLAVHAEGVLRPLSDPEAVRLALLRLTEQYEGSGGFAAVPGDLVERLVRGIAPFELEIETLSGKAKLSQNKTAADRAGVIAALEARAEPGGLAVAAEMRRREARA